MLQSVSALDSRTGATGAPDRTRADDRQPGSANARPFPPGDYPRRRRRQRAGRPPGRATTCAGSGIEHAVISADPSPGGMFRRFPFFQRLLSWTKPYAPLPHDSREYEWYDWNSLLAVEPENRALMPDLMDGTSEFPSRPEMEAGPAPLRRAHRPARPLRHAAGRAPRATASASCCTPRTATTAARSSSSPSASPSRVLPDTPGFEHVAHYVDTRDRRRPTRASGSSSSASRTPASSWPAGLLQWASRSSSPRRGRPSCRSTRIRWRACARATSSRGRTQTWAAASSSSTRRSSASSARRRPRRAHAAAPTTAQPFVGRGGRGHRRDRLHVPAPRPRGARRQHVFGRSGLPSMTNYYESATVPGIFFAGTIGQGVAGLKKYGIPANSGAVHGRRYNARLMVDHVAERLISADVARAAGGRPERVVDSLLRGHDRARAVEPEVVPRARRLARPGRRRARRGHRVAGRVRRRRRARRRRDHRRDRRHAATSIPRSTCAERGRVDGDAPLDEQPLHDYRPMVIGASSATWSTGCAARPGAVVG